MRFIPACAGNILDYPLSQVLSSVHPRVCGEHRLHTIGNRGPCGSSPRVRGTSASAANWRKATRFIPACAGNIRSWCASSRPPPVHPRVCGEHKVLVRVESAPTGSSPRVRGTCQCVAYSVLQCRFIPACAGNIHFSGRGFRCPPVHPRVCGEHRKTKVIRSMTPGSSPRVRGTYELRQSAVGLHRFIPACAGNIPRHRFPRLRRTVHPRVCGEHSHARRETRIANGSSPRVRGTLRWGPFLLEINRFIPACAGNIRPCRCTPGSGSVHPRVCGEHFSFASMIACQNGSSPRVRGTFEDQMIELGLDRFIPACAGNIPSC